MLYSRYGSFAQEVLHMEPEKGFRLYFYALNQIQEERIFTRWVHGYQFSMEYGEFRGKIIGEMEVAPVQPEEQTQEEILAKVKGIIGGRWHGDI